VRTVAARHRRGDPEATRAGLVKGALQEFNEHGYYGTDSNRIARTAGYAPGTFYNHFLDKAEVFVAAYETWVLEEWRELELELGTRPFTTCHADHVVGILASLHERWAVFRASLRALVAVDERVRAAYRSSRSMQLERIAAARRGFDTRGNAEDDALLMFLVERTLDALADGECAFHGLSRELLLERLAKKLVQHFDPASDAPPASRQRSVRR
jgi:AcrR family transcriptional regulator